MLAEQGRPTVPVPSIDPQAKGTPQGKPPTSKSFRRLPLPLPKSRRNRPYIQGDVLVWQDNIIRDEDYDVWGFHVPTQGLYLINAPEPVSNQTSPVINDLRGYVAWTDDGTKRSGVDLYAAPAEGDPDPVGRGSCTSQAARGSSSMEWNSRGPGLTR